MWVFVGEWHVGDNKEYMCVCIMIVYVMHVWTSYTSTHTILTHTQPHTQITHLCIIHSHLSMRPHEHHPL